MKEQTTNSRKDLYYQMCYQRGQLFSHTTRAVMLWVFLFPKLVIDVFLRRNMGERYFTPIAAIMTGIVLYFLPSLLTPIYGYGMQRTPFYTAFLIAFTAMCLKRFWEIKQLPSVYEGERFSLSKGDPYPFFYKISLNRKPASLRSIEVWYEPLLCFAVSFLVFAIGQVLVALILGFCTFCYFMCNWISALQSDSFVMETQDKKVCAEDCKDLILENREVSRRGVACFANKPNSREKRQEFVDYLYEKDDAAIVL